MYENLTNVEPKYLLTFDHVLSFTSKELHIESLPKQCILDSILSCAETYEKEVVQLLNIMVPKLAEGFSNQRGAIFGFGPNADKDTGTIFKLSKADGSKRVKFLKAPVHNLKEEKSVGQINYELHIRGREHLEAVSRKLVMNKNIDVLNQAMKSKIKLKTFKKPAEDIRELKVKWNAKLQQHQKSGYEHQEFLNLKKDRQKHELLEDLKNQAIPGPFTNPNEVKFFISETKDNKENVRNRMRKEVKYARTTCSYMKPTASVFRLMRNSKPLSTEEYVENLTTYLDTTRSHQSLTMDDLNNVLASLTENDQQVPINDPITDYSEEKSTTESQEFQPDEHVAVFWLDRVYEWHLGVVNSVNQDESLNILYYNHSDSTRRYWTNHEDDSYKTPKDQILCRNIKVEYMRSIKIKCKISDENLVSILDASVEELNNKL